MSSIALINDIFERVKGVKGIVVAGEDGLPIIERLEADIDPEEVSGQILAVINNIRSLGLGKVDEIFFNNDRGILYYCKRTPDNYFLIALASPEVIRGKLKFYLDILSSKIKI